MLIMPFLLFYVGPNCESTAAEPHTHIGCLSWFSVHCVKFVLLCSSSEKTFAKINLFSFFGSYIAIGEKGGNIGSHPKPKSTFFVEIKNKS